MFRYRAQHGGKEKLCRKKKYVSKAELPSVQNCNN